jgi:hypothetical protein
VLTFVGAYEERQIVAAIRRELLRDGQVFYIHNRVESIERAASRLAELVPEARIAVAHGQLGEHRLEQVIVDFWDKRFDVLVCTTIVENGLDISNANTLIVERSENLGLSQLHQLRGRVGRGRERAYSYFLYPPERPLTETAYDRLQTIAQHTDLGAGMHVAMKDLEIRGAGNLLGGEQSGHIAGVGFDLYVRLVGEAVAEFRGGKDTGHAEVKIDLPVDAHLPHSYVPGERLRLEAYRKIAEAGSDAEVDAIRDELQDRYGTPPEPVTNLLAVARFRVKARAAGLSEVTVQGNHVRFAPVELPESGPLPPRSTAGHRTVRRSPRAAAARRRGAGVGRRADRRGAAGQRRGGQRRRRFVGWVASSPCAGACRVWSSSPRCSGRARRRRGRRRWSATAGSRCRTCRARPRTCAGWSARTSRWISRRCSAGWCWRPTSWTRRPGAASVPPRTTPASSSRSTRSAGWRTRPRPRSAPCRARW